MRRRFLLKFPATADFPLSSPQGTYLDRPPGSEKYSTQPRLKLTEPPAHDYHPFATVRSFILRAHFSLIVMGFTLRRQQSWLKKNSGGEGRHKPDSQQLAHARGARVLRTQT